MLSLIPRRSFGTLRTSSLRKARTARGVPSWMGAVGEWCTVAGGTLAASGIQQDFSGSAGVFAYSGGIINSVGLYHGDTFLFGTFLVIWGGGHADYSGNEVYAFGPLEDDVPAWRRLRDRTSPAPDDVNEDGSGNPVSRHTYGNIQYLPDTNEMITAGGLYRYHSAGGVTVAHVFDFDQTAPNTNNPWETRGSGLSQGQYSAYEPSSGRIWYQPSSAEVGYFTISNNTQTEANFKSPLATSDGHGVIDTSRGIWFSFGGATFQAYRTNNGTSNDFYAPSTTETAPTGTCTPLYDPVDDVIRVWNGNGKQIFTLTPPGSNPYEGGFDWTWSSSTPAGGVTPGTANSTGTFGRFGYVHSVNKFRGYLLCNAANQSVVFYRAA